MLRFCREHPDAVEVDLARFYGVDWRDQWRYDAQGRRQLTLRQIMVRLRHLPAESATAAIDNNGVRPWSRTEHLLDDLRRYIEAGAGVKDPKPHPERLAAVQPKKPDPKRALKLADARRRARERRERLKNEAG